MPQEEQVLRVKQETVVVVPGKQGRESAPGRDLLQVLLEQQLSMVAAETVTTMSTLLELPDPELEHTELPH
jgi:hypothetical protein